MDLARRGSGRGGGDWGLVVAEDVKGTHGLMFLSIRHPSEGWGPAFCGVEWSKAGCQPSLAGRMEGELLS
jgi:hypothetical protein